MNQVAAPGDKGASDGFNRQLVVRTNDMDNYPEVKVTISGRQTPTSIPRSMQYLYFHEQLTGGLLRFQTIRFRHRGPLKKYGSMVFPLNSSEEPFLYQRIQQLEDHTEDEMLQYLSQEAIPGFVGFQSSANIALNAKRMLKTTISIEAEAQCPDQEYQRALAKALRPTYKKKNNWETAWLRFSEELQIFNSKGERLEGNPEDILKAGTYELIIRASSICLALPATASPFDYTIGNLMLRIAQVRYEPNPDGERTSMPRNNEYLFQPPIITNLVQAQQSQVEQGSVSSDTTPDVSEFECDYGVNLHNCNRHQALGNSSQLEPFSLWPHAISRPPSPIHISSQSTELSSQSQMRQPSSYGAPLREHHYAPPETDWQAYWTNLHQSVENVTQLPTAAAAPVSETPRSQEPQPSPSFLEPIKAVRRRQQSGQGKKRKFDDGLPTDNPIDIDENSQHV